MRLLLVAGISLSGWIITGTYLIYEYHEFGALLNEHFLSRNDYFVMFFHLIILIVPVGSTVTGFLVNERIKLINDIRGLERRYRDYYDNAPCGYHSFGPDLTLLDVNHTWLRMLGYTKDEVVGKMKVTDLIDGEGGRVFQKHLPLLLETGKVDNIQVEFRKKGGGTLPVLINSTALYDTSGDFLRSRTIVEDYTQRKNYEEALKTVASEWKETFDSMPWGVMVLDRNGSVLRANEYFGEQCLSTEELASTVCAEVIRGIEQRTGKEQDRGGTGVAEFSAPGTGRFYRLYGKAVYLGGYVLNYVFSIVDITDMKEGEKKLLDSRDAFFNMLKDANEAYRELNGLHGNLVVAFANAIDAKSPWTKGHSERVTMYAMALAREVGMNESRLAELRTAALLHDIGKIGTYDFLLDKPDGLTAEEYELVKKHPVKSVSILEPIGSFQPIIDIIKHHHERYDGKGYPVGLKGEDIPFLARILCIADSYDSMSSDRPYRKARSREYAIGEFRRCSGIQFDPELAEMFIRMLESGFE